MCWLLRVLGIFLQMIFHKGKFEIFSLLDSTNQLVNGHFNDDSFLSLIEDKENVSSALKCLDTFCLALGSAIH